MNTSLVSSGNWLSFHMPLELGAKRLIAVPGESMDPSLMIVREGRSSSASDYRVAATNLLNGPAQTTSRIFVTSPGQGDGKTCTAFNLAWALADSGKSVLLVELNFSKPRFRVALGNLQLRHGLDSALRGFAVPEDAVFSVASLGLHIVAVRDATPIGKLDRLLEHLNAFLDWGSEHYDLLVVDCPPVISSDWNRWFRNFIGPSLLVVRENQTPLVQVQRATRLLGQHLVGVVLNSTHTSSAVPATNRTEGEGEMAS